LAGRTVSKSSYLTIVHGFPRNASPLATAKGAARFSTGSRPAALHALFSDVQSLIVIVMVSGQQLMTTVTAASLAVAAVRGLSTIVASAKCR